MAHVGNAIADYPVTTGMHFLFERSMRGWREIMQGINLNSEK